MDLNVLLELLGLISVTYRSKFSFICAVHHFGHHHASKHLLSDAKTEWQSNGHD